MARITIIGAGSWGSALARICGDNHHDVMLYDTDLAIIAEINQSHTNLSKLPIGKLPENVIATGNLEEALRFSEMIMLSVPTKVMRMVLEEIRDLLTTPKLFVNTSKGLEPTTFKRVSEIVFEVIPQAYQKGFVALTGPSHAEEVILQLPTTICSISDNPEYAKMLQYMFSNAYFRIYTGSDLIGAELCSAIKNVYAIASGMLGGLGYGDNARAGLITRALVELRRLVIAMGAREETIYGLTGVGDLIVTTTSEHSRNYQAGVKLAQGKNLDETIASITMVVEGARTTIAAYELARKLQIETPIIDAVYHVIYDKMNVREAVNELMLRQLKDE